EQDKLIIEIRKEKMAFDYDTYDSKLLSDYMSPKEFESLLDKLNRELTRAFFAKKKNDEIQTPKWIYFLTIGILVFFGIYLIMIYRAPRQSNGKNLKFASITFGFIGIGGLLVLEIFLVTKKVEPDKPFNDFFIRLLKGEIKGEEQNEYLLNNKISQNACECLIINIENGKNTEAKEFIENYIEEDDILIDLSNDLLALIKFESQTDIEYRSINEYAIFLLQSVYEETGATAKVYIGGKVNSVKDVNISFSQAENTKRISNKLCEGGNVHNYKEHVFYKILEDVGSYKLNEYLNTLLDYNESKIFEDEEMISTAEEFLENNLNVSETSRKMYLHRNTLIYRLDKIENVT
ncbi:MAG: helix-turn-helix domain-containing protein, partial [Clostridia bacterium]|nr:helix-turn-helix domain-containing protein [Clostridia bacterium]